MAVRGNGQRIAIWVIVITFFLTSVGFTGIVVWDALRNKEGDNTTQGSEDIQKQLEELQKKESKEGKLEGTKLSGFTPIAKVEKLEATDLKPGTGAEVKKGGTVTAHYTGALAKDGTIFQSSKDTGQPFTASLSGVIKGWQEGIPGMKVGGVRRLVIPAELAYGGQATGNIPANSDLVFDIELIETK